LRRQVRVSIEGAPEVLMKAVARLTTLVQAVQDGRQDVRLTDDDVRSIRRRVAGGESQAAVARAFGVSRQYVSRLCSGRARKNVW
jgi:hypothetical protein